MEIKLCESQQVGEVFSILQNCKKDLDRQGVYQWTDNYPSPAIVEKDIEKGHLYCAIVDGRCAGIICLSDEQEAEYAAIAWNYNSGNILVIHRLAVDPACQGRGIARQLMDFAEQYGIDNGYSSVRLDAFSANGRVLKFYENRGYEKRGEVYFPGRTSPFFCYEKALTGR